MIRIHAEPPLDDAGAGRIRTLLDAECAARTGEAADRVALDLAVLDDAGMERLNAAHAGRSGTTDVLAFPDGAVDPDDGRRRLGDVAINRSLAAREADARGVDPGEELALYAIHGLLHLLGFDDQSPDDRAAMRRAEAAALARIGVVPRWTDGEATEAHG